MPRVKRAVRKNLNTFQRRYKRIQARLGRGDGADPAVSGHPYLVRARPEGSGRTIIVHNVRGAPNIDGWPVVVGESDANPGMLQVLETNLRISRGLPGAAGVGPHAAGHYIDGADPVYIHTKQITPLAIYPVSGMTIGVNPGWIATPYGAIYVQAQTLDLTSLIPAALACWVGIQIDETGALNANKGEEIAFVDLTWDYAPPVDIDNAILYYVRLYANQTAVSNSIHAPDLYDVRFTPLYGVLFGSGAAFDIGARVYNTANLSINNATDTALTFNSERWDTDGLHSTVSNTSRLTCTRAGKYAITGHVEFAANATGGRQVFLRLNGATDIGRVAYTSASATIPSRMIPHAEYDLEVGDYVELYVTQNSGGALNVVAAAQRSPEFEMQLISASSTIRWADRFLLMGG
jgi:hypothetical protein